MYPAWTPDGTAITFNSDRSGQGGTDLYQRLSDLSGPIELIASSSGNDNLATGSWTPDGQTLVDYEINSQTGRDLWLLSRDGAPRPFLVTEFNEKSPVVSPNGIWVAYVSDRSGEDRVYAQPFPESGAAIPISLGAGSEPVWSRNGREVFYRSGDQMLVVDVESDGKQLTVGRPRVLFAANYDPDPFNSGFANYDVSPDGQQFLMIMTDQTPDGEHAPLRINVVLNWFEELKTRVPTGR